APGGGMLASGLTGLYAVNDQDGELISDTRFCQALVATSDTQALCADPTGGLSLIEPSAPTAPAPATLAPELFGKVPTSVWAQATAAWGSGPTDVWRPPLDHFDGATWTTH